jgi:arginase
MPEANLLSELQVIAVPYARGRFVGEEHQALNAYRSSGVYESVGVPFEIAEPRIPHNFSSQVESETLGALCGTIADVVARARRAGKGVLMTGGNCHSAPGVLGGLQDAHGPGARIGLAWFDAHGDFNTPRTTLSGSLGGMPVAVCAGLAFPDWREGAHITAPLPTDRVVMTDLRNLDAPEETLIRATDVVVADLVPGRPGPDFGQAVADLAGRVDMIYLHIDADILDEAHVPSHRTKEPGGPDMAQVLAAVEAVMATGKVVALAVVSVYFQGQDCDVDLASGVELVRGGLTSWRRHGMPRGGRVPG